jgi:putative oxidoreductase
LAGLHLAICIREPERVKATRGIRFHKDELMTSLSPYALTLLRVVAGALLLEHGLIKLIGFPDASSMIPFEAVTQWQLPQAQLWIGGVIETITGVMLILGLLTRPAAFLAAGLTAVAFWQFHFSRAGVVFPAMNGGEPAVLFCFIFIYILFAGPGALSFDAAPKK